MTKWKEYILGELVQTNKKSINSDYSFEEIEYLDTGSITRGKIESFQKYKLSEAPSRAKRLVEQSDIIYSTVRPIQRHYGFIENPLSNLVVSTGFTTITCEKERLNPKFLYYLLSSDDTVEYLDIIADASTSAYPSLRPSDIENLDITIPELPEQKAIAETLSSLDDKIDLLHRQNKTLEQMAETLFRQWFVEEEVKLKPLGKCIQTTSGGTPSRINMDFYANGTIQWIKSKELNRGYLLDTEEKITEEAIKNSSAKILPENSVLIAMYGATVGEYAIIGQQATCNQAICACIPNKDFPYTYIYYTIKANKDELINMAVGSAQQNISQVLIKTLDIPVDIQKIRIFHDEVDPMMKKIKLNYMHINNLEKIRDTLLPKLMSGEVRVYV